MSDSVLDMNLEEVPDLEVTPAGEYRLRLVSAKHEPSKSSGNPQISVMFSVEDKENAQPIFDHFGTPIPGEPNSNYINNSLRRLKTLCHAFRLDPVRPNLETWPGASAWCILSVEDSPGYGPQNKVKRYGTGK